MSVLELNDLLIKAGIEAEKTVVMRHRPTEPELRRVLPWLAQERPEIFNAYQCQHGPRVESSLARAKYLVSFIGHDAGYALFIGVYHVVGARRIGRKAFWAMPENQMLRAYGTRGPREGGDPLWFDLQLLPALAELKGRLTVQWPGIERAWCRRAERNRISVAAIHAESVLVPAMPPWQELVLSWRQLSLIPEAWRHALAQWRGIYFIFDSASGRGYVGSASGKDNLLGRWLNYAASGHGGNRLLRDCDPEAFEFSILQRTSPDMDASEIAALENTWKARLHSRAPAGLNDN